MITDAAEVRHLLGIPEFAPDFHGVISTEPDHLFKDAVCDDCDLPAAVYAEYTVLDTDEGYVATDSTFCVEHAAQGVQCLLERADRSTDHDTIITVNYWAARYGAFERAA